MYGMYLWAQTARFWGRGVRGHRHHYQYRQYEDIDIIIDTGADTDRRSGARSEGRINGILPTVCRHTRSTSCPSSIGSNMAIWSNRLNMQAPVDAGPRLHKIRAEALVATSPKPDTLQQWPPQQSHGNGNHQFVPGRPEEQQKVLKMG